MILAEDLEWLVVRRASLVNEIVDALLARYQFLSLPNRRTQSAEYKALLANPPANPAEYDAAFWAYRRTLVTQPHRHAEAQH